jgi:hypothetical protein
MVSDTMKYDEDADLHPEAREACDGIDNDCDGLVDGQDDDVKGASFWFRDSDGDGYGVTEDYLRACEQPAGRVERYGDCDDADAVRHLSGS